MDLKIKVKVEGDKIKFLTRTWLPLVTGKDGRLRSVQAPDSRPTSWLRFWLRLQFPKNGVRLQAWLRLRTRNRPSLVTGSGRCVKAWEFPLRLFRCYRWPPCNDKVSTDRSPHPPCSACNPVMLSSTFILLVLHVHDINLMFAVFHRVYFLCNLCKWNAWTGSLKQTAEYRFFHFRLLHSFEVVFL